MGPSLTEILDAAAVGHLPPPDGGTTVVPQDSGREAGGPPAGPPPPEPSEIVDPDRPRVRRALRRRHEGLGRPPAPAGRHPVPGGAPVRDRQAAGNARGIRTFPTAGYRPIGAEALLPVPEAARAAR